jgi:putative hemolysin
VKSIHEFYESDYHLVTFPAGVTSFKKRGKIIDHPWRKGFVKAAVQHHRNVVPLYFEAQNSSLFYFIENLRKSIRFPINFEVCLFAKEFFKQRGKSVTLHIGKPICWEQFDETKSMEEWAEMVREKVYGMSAK